MTGLQELASRAVLGRRRSKNPVVGALVRHTLILCALAILLYPIIWMVAASFRPANEVFTTLGFFTPTPRPTTTRRHGARAS